MDGFSSLEELYNRVKPALRSKVKEMNRIGVHYVQEADIWNYLKNNSWCKKKDLSLAEMVNDIMCTPNIELERYVQDLMASEKREIKKENLL